jgi:hypothetical protein
MLTPPWPLSIVWDLAFFGRRDRLAERSLDEPLDRERMEWWMTRMRSVIARVRDRWPHVPVWYRKMHRIGDQFWASHDWSPGVNMGEGFVNFFTNE